MPGLGSLQLRDGIAVVDHTEKTIAAPQPLVRFTKKELPAFDLVNFLAATQHTSRETATEQLEVYLAGIRGMEPGERKSFATVGEFYRDDAGSLVFEQRALPADILPAVTAERVIHPNEAHQMLVGDTHTTTTAMSEFYNAEDQTARSKWWIAALVMALIAIATIVYYFNDTHHNKMFGNAQQVKPATAAPTYDSSR
ncbi:MAG: hypothetical protein JWQ27_3283 [Ferruginibacter sp.]|nr:hypothetical protein [Ferruginibacter sp.]